MTRNSCLVLVHPQAGQKTWPRKVLFASFVFHMSPSAWHPGQIAIRSRRGRVMDSTSGGSGFISSSPGHIGVHGMLVVVARGIARRGALHLDHVGDVGRPRGVDVDRH